MVEKEEIKLIKGKDIELLKRTKQEKGLPPLVKSVQRATRVTPPQERMTFHQQVLSQQFGGGEKIWGTIGEPVQINHALGGGRDTSTARLFGFG